MTTPDLDAVVLPPYIYGREAAQNENVWTEAAVRAAVLADRARRAAPSDGAMRFVGWFREIPSTINYRLWEQSWPAENDDGRDVMLYERCEP